MNQRVTKIVAAIASLVLASAVIIAPAVSRSTAAAGTGIDWKAIESRKIAGTAIQWTRSFAEAKARAARERKPILLLHLFGRLDESLC